MDKTPKKIKTYELQIAGWMLIKDQLLMKFNLGIDAETIVGEDQCIVGNIQNIGIGIVLEGVQRYFCMDIQRSKRDSTKVGTT